MKTKTFESLHVWHDARRLTKRLYGLTREEPFARDFGLCDQIRRAAVSVMANIAEGYERRGRAEYLRFLSIAQASAAEVRSHIYVAEDAEYLTSEKALDLREAAACLSRRLASLRATIEGPER